MRRKSFQRAGPPETANIDVYKRQTIQNVNLTGSLTNTISDASGSHVGAVAGYIVGGAIRNCSTSEFTIKSSSDDLTLGQAVGGIVGVAESTQVENCVSGTGITLNFKFYYIGGVAGAAVGSQVVNCSYTGTLTIMGSGYADSVSYTHLSKAD